MYQGVGLWEGLGPMKSRKWVEGGTTICMLLVAFKVPMILAYISSLMVEGPRIKATSASIVIELIPNREKRGQVMVFDYHFASFYFRLAKLLS